jgi:hypothetical protein
MTDLIKKRPVAKAKKERPMQTVQLCSTRPSLTEAPAKYLDAMIALIQRHQSSHPIGGTTPHPYVVLCLMLCVNNRLLFCISARIPLADRLLSCSGNLLIHP